MILDDLDFSGLAPPDADAVVHYGNDALQFGELRLPRGSGPHPVMILIHGGCWLAESDLSNIRFLAAAFSDEGIATWTLEYRRVGNEGGGWPGTFDDAAEGAAHLHELAQAHSLDMSNVITAGHSAGGHLGLWLANVPDAMQPERPLPQLRGVLALAPAADLEFLFHEKACDHVVDKLMGGSPEELPDRYQAGSVVNRLPLKLPQHVIIGLHDTDWAPVGERYVAAARAAGDDVTRIVAHDSGHFEMVDPRTSTWPTVLESARSLLSIG